IFDEVITGFRQGPGGVQEQMGILPDLTTLAKILSGGLPGGAVVGRAEVMAVFGPGTRLDRPRGRLARVPHTGTVNGNLVPRAARLRGVRLQEGVGTHHVHGWVSAGHDDAVIDASAEAFDRAFARLRTADGFRM